MLQILDDWTHDIIVFLFPVKYQWVHSISKKSDQPPFIRLWVLLFISTAIKKVLANNISNWKAASMLADTGKLHMFFFFPDLMSNEQECYTKKSPSCKEYKLPNALLIYGNSTRISYPNLTLIHWVCQSKRHTIAKDGTKTDHTINQDVEPNDLFTKISMTQIRSTIID